MRANKRSQLPSDPLITRLSVTRNALSTRVVISLRKGMRGELGGDGGWGGKGWEQERKKCAILHFSTRT